MDYLSNGMFDAVKIYEKFVAKRDNHLTPFTADSLGIKYNNYKYLNNNDYISTNSYSKLKESGAVTDNVLYKSFVKSIIEDDEIDTFDLVLPEEHLFWCEGFYVHNSGRRGALMMVISCFEGSTQILTENGWIAIKTIVDTKYNGKVWTHEGFKEIEAYQKIESKDLYEVECENGKKITVTGDHKFMVRNILTSEEYLVPLLKINHELEEMIFYTEEK
jgi:intein/homing endonuclease